VPFVYNLPDHRVMAINQVYERYLGQPATPDEIAGWLVRMGTSFDPTRITRSVLSSPGYIARFHYRGAYLKSLQSALLTNQGRATSAWVRAVSLTSRSNSQLVARLQQSAQGYARTVLNSFTTYLGHAPTASESKFWTSALSSGRATVPEMEVRILASKQNARESAAGHAAGRFSLAGGKHRARLQ
jgi:hypothetical protein